MKNFEKLRWDSDFFGFPVWKINGEWLIEDLEKPFREDVELIYFYSEKRINLVEKANSFYNIILVDEKVPLKKKLDRVTEIHPNISVYDLEEAEDELVFLAQNAGGSSRFKVDPNISEEKYKELYEIWIRRSVSGDLADQVLVYKINKTIVGFATISINNHKPYVSLLAVKPDFEGKGVAFALMRSVEKILRDSGYDEVYGATQLSNRKALVVYERYGLKRQQIKYIYHFWRK